MWNMLNLLSPLSTSWPCPLKPGRARPLYSHQSIIWHQPSTCHPVPGRSHIPNCQITGDVTHRCHMWWRSPTFSLGPSGPPGVLTSPADQAHRGGQGAAKQLNLAEEAFPTSGFPAALALPQPPAYVPAARLPPSSADTLNLFSKPWPASLIVSPVLRLSWLNNWDRICGVFSVLENSFTKSNPCCGTTAWKMQQYNTCSVFFSSWSKASKPRFLCRVLVSLSFIFLIQSSSSQKK